MRPSWTLQPDEFRAGLALLADLGAANTLRTQNQDRYGGHQLKENRETRCPFFRGKYRDPAIATMIMMKAKAPKVPAKKYPKTGTKRETTVRIMQVIAAVVAVLRVFKVGAAGGKG
jgi:hypothetical protein